jgi:hypothetical protein
MTVNILRWKGGFGGDSLLNMICNSIPDVKTNVNFLPGFTEHGSTQLESKLHITGLSYVELMALENNHVPDNEISYLTNELTALDNSNNIWWLKSHQYNFDLFNHVTVDIEADLLSLPFVVSANINKTLILEKNYNELASMIPDKETKIKYAAFSLAKEFIATPKYKQSISVSQLLAGWQSVYYSMKTFNVELNNSTKSFYKRWVANNQKYIPSNVYQQKITNQSYNIDHPKLSTIEKYCLLAISGNKFKLLHD